ncbi:hypothetical protein [Methanimicrococcus hongohii]|uniref:hypothetical protein n=1 Tax=Methanimicrococcus hongohii TaxID=3028295 RepID=UPI00292ED63D|nr:hypothetical protein [Methanimicrococcus sp. Hf6]
MSEKKMSEKKMSEKKIKADKIKADKNVFGKMNLSKEIQKRISSEKDPEIVMEKALENYYGGQKRRYENALQKEIDNNIIEIQRRHISDLKDQLESSNKNYEELMKTYQAYMLQVQPLVEAAQLQKAAELRLQEEKNAEPKDSKEYSNESKEKIKEEIKEEIKGEMREEIIEEIRKEKAAEDAKVEEIEKEKQNELKNSQASEPEIKTKKWYEFWK